MASPPQTKPVPWIKVTDLEEGAAWLSIMNTTTMTQAKDMGAIDICELSKTGMVLRAPANLCSEGHHLTLTVKLCSRNPMERGGEAKEAASFEATAKVIQEERFDKTSKIITVQFYQFDDKAWEDILARFSSRQEAAQAILRKMSG